jgi:hypothetical protein
MAKIMKMVKAGASPAKIQHTIVEMIAAECVAVLGKAMATGTSVQRAWGTEQKRY